MLLNSKRERSLSYREIDFQKRSLNDRCATNLVLNSYPFEKMEEVKGILQVEKLINDDRLENEVLWFYW